MFGFSFLGDPGSRNGTDHHKRGTGVWTVYDVRDWIRGCVVPLRAEQKLLVSL